MEKFIELTAVNGNKVFINIRHISMLTERADGHTSIDTVNSEGGPLVKGDYEDVKKLITGE